MDIFSPDQDDEVQNKKDKNVKKKSYFLSEELKKNQKELKNELYNEIESVSSDIEEKEKRLELSVDQDIKNDFPLLDSTLLENSGSKTFRRNLYNRLDSLNIEKDNIYKDTNDLLPEKEINTDGKKINYEEKEINEDVDSSFDLIVNGYEDKKEQLIDEDKKEVGLKSDITNAKKEINYSKSSENLNSDLKDESYINEYKIAEEKKYEDIKGKKNSKNSEPKNSEPIKKKNSSKKVIQNVRKASIEFSKTGKTSTETHYVNIGDEEVSIKFSVDDNNEDGFKKKKCTIEDKEYVFLMNDDAISIYEGSDIEDGNLIEEDKIAENPALLIAKKVGTISNDNIKIEDTDQEKNFIELKELPNLSDSDISQIVVNIKINGKDNQFNVSVGNVDGRNGVFIDKRELKDVVENFENDGFDIDGFELHLSETICKQVVMLYYEKEQELLQENAKIKPTIEAVSSKIIEDEKKRLAKEEEERKIAEQKRLEEEKKKQEELERKRLEEERKQRELEEQRRKEEEMLNLQLWKKDKTEEVEKIKESNSEKRNNEIKGQQSEQEVRKYSTLGDDIDQDIAENDKKKERLEEEKKELQEQIANSRNKLDEQKSSLGNKINSLELNDSLNDDKNQILSEIEELKNKQKEIEELNSKIQENEKNLNQVDVNLKSLNDNKITLQEEEKKKQEEERKQRELDEQKRLEEEKKRLEEEKKKQQELEQKRNSSLDKLNKLKEELNNYKIDQIDKEEKKDDKIDSDLKTSDNVKLEIDKLQSELNKKAEEYKKDESEIQKNDKDLQSKLNDTEEFINKSKSIEEIEGKENEISNIESDIQNHNQNKLKSSQLNTEISELEKRIAELDKLKNKLEDEELDELKVKKTEEMKNNFENLKNSVNEQLNNDFELTEEEKTLAKDEVQGFILIGGDDLGIDEISSKLSKNQEKLTELTKNNFSSNEKIKNTTDEVRKNMEKLENEVSEKSLQISQAKDKESVLKIPLEIEFKNVNLADEINGYKKEEKISSFKISELQNNSKQLEFLLSKKIEEKKQEELERKRLEEERKIAEKKRLEEERKQREFEEKKKKAEEQALTDQEKEFIKNSIESDINYGETDCRPYVKLYENKKKLTKDERATYNNLKKILSIQEKLMLRDEIGKIEEDKELLKISKKIKEDRKENNDFNEDFAYARINEDYALRQSLNQTINSHVLRNIDKTSKKEYNLKSPFMQNSFLKKSFSEKIKEIKKNDNKDKIIDCSERIEALLAIEPDDKLKAKIGINKVMIRNSFDGQKSTQKSQKNGKHNFDKTLMSSREELIKSKNIINTHRNIDPKKINVHLKKVDNYVKESQNNSMYVG